MKWISRVEDINPGDTFIFCHRMNLPIYDRCMSEGTLEGWTHPKFIKYVNNVLGAMFLMLGHEKDHELGISAYRALVDDTVGYIRLREEKLHSVIKINDSDDG